MCVTDNSNLLADDVDQERQDFLEKLEACAAPRKQVHELEWELKKRADEIRDLQKVSQAYLVILVCSTGSIYSRQHASLIITLHFIQDIHALHTKHQTTAVILCLSSIE